MIGRVLCEKPESFLKGAAATHHNSRGQSANARLALLWSIQFDKFFVCRQIEAKDSNDLADCFKSDCERVVLRLRGE
ncbi:hypothetical protein LSTR_LSTR004984 [Laodelphax striatellus]|uniref:Uncharacterized protein n=1 Tax=Laodelphax striatellus TaxID=195883 RepID=A0A482XMC5_LAOST|nr:hypothetical protein LSTR_LSTR004984 [Laodelphax striatellus]